MAITSGRFTQNTLPLGYDRVAEHVGRAVACRRLTEVFEAAPEILFDDSSRIVLFSDCHRGDKSRADTFARNEWLFLHALAHYYHEGFTYIEVGDGDELWKNRQFNSVRQAHERIFDLLHELDQQNRLYLIVGNHDIQGGRRDPVKKDGIIAQEGLVLRHSKTGQCIFVVHGHQADFTSDRLYMVGRFVVRTIWKRLQLVDFARVTSRRGCVRKPDKTERRIVEWARANWQMVICGHTHRPTCATYGAPPYFNAGSCTYPGYITGLEVQDGEIRLVKWSARSSAGQKGAASIERELLTPPRKLCLFGHSQGAWDARYNSTFLNGARARITTCS